MCPARLQPPAAGGLWQSSGPVLAQTQNISHNIVLSLVQPAAGIIRLWSLSWIRCCTVTLSHYCHTLPILSHRCHNQHGSCELSNSLLVTMSMPPPNTHYMHSAKPSSAPPRAHIKTVFHGATESVPSALREEDKLSKCGLSGIDFFNFHWVLLR